MKKAISIILIFMFLFTMSGCGEPPKSQPAQKESSAAKEDPKVDGFDKSWHDAKTIKIGMAIALTGPNAQLGIDAKRGAEIALKDIDSKINGKPIELIVYDEKGTPEQSMKAVTRLIEQDKVNVIYGPTLSNSIMAVMPTAEAAKTPLIGAAVGAGWTKQGWKYVFRPVCNTYYQLVESKRVFKKLGVKKVAIFNINDEYGNGSKNDVIKILEAEGGYTVAATETYKTGDQDFTGQIAKIIQSGADTVYMAVLSADAGLFVKQLRKAGYNKPLIGDNTWSAKAVREVGGDAANDVYFTAPYVLPDTAEDIKSFESPIMKKFLTTYFADYKEAPLSDNTYRAYDGFKVLFKGIEKAKSLDGTKIMETIQNINDYEGLGGKFNYQGANGDGIKTARIFVIKSGKFQEVKD